MRRAIPRLRTLRATPTTPAISTVPNVLRNPSVFTRTLATERLPIRDRLRRKLWGTDSPPGQQDPYTRQTELAEIDEDEIDRSNYVEATDARALQILGLDEPRGRWEIDSFIPSTPVRETEALLCSFHKAVVEVFTLELNGHAAGELISMDTAAPKELLGFTGGLEFTDLVDIVVAENGEVRLVYPDRVVEVMIMQGVGAEVDFQEAEAKEAAPEPAAAPESATAPAEAAETVETAATPPMSEQWIPDREAWLSDGLSNRGWVTMPLRSIDTKFAIVKRVLQLTGQKIPDHIASQATTVGDLLQPLFTPEKPKKLADELAQNEKLMSLPNVKLFESRLRPYDREKMLGRAIPRDEVADHTYAGIDEAIKVKAWKGHVVYR